MAKKKQQCEDENAIAEWQDVPRQKKVAQKVEALTSHKADTIRVLPLFPLHKDDSSIAYYRVNVMEKIKRNIVDCNRITESYMIRYSAANDEIRVITPQNAMKPTDSGLSG